jgi:hypothetical protein
MSILELASEITRDSFVGDGAGKSLIFQPLVHASLIG